MSMIPDEELRRSANLNLAPMVDFLFLLLAVFAALAVTRAALYDSEVSLVQVRAADKQAPQQAQNEFYTVNLTVTSDGRYKWLTEDSEFLMENISAIQQEISNQQEIGLLPKEKSKTKVLMHIDQHAEWAPIADLIFAIKEAGFTIHPVYEPKDK
jgi:biopolymer transport protein ExbD